MFRTQGKKWAGLLLVVVLALIAMPISAFAESASLQIGTTANDVAVTAGANTVEKAQYAFKKQTVKMNVAMSKSMVVANGTYYIATSPDTRNVACVKGKNALVKPLGKNKANTWKLTFDKAAQAYYIVNAKTGKYLTVSGKKAKKKANVCQEKAIKAKKSSSTDGSALQQWRIISTSAGYRLCSAADTKLYLTAKNGNLTVSKYTGRMQKFWLLKSSGKNFLKGGTYTISDGNGKLLSVPSDSIVSGKKLELKSNKATLGQVFDIEYRGNGYYRIRNVNSGQYVTASGKKAIQQPLGNKKSTHKHGKKTYVYRGLNKAQVWKAKLLDDGTVQFKNRKTHKLLNLKGCTNWKISPSAPGINAIGKKALWKANKRTSRTKWCIVADLTWHELFVFEKVNPSNEGGPWRLYNTWRISSGSRSNWTSAKDNYVSHHTFTFGGFNCFYWTHLTGSGFFHSVLYASSSYPNRVTDGRLGMYISHGCMRMKLENAKWIYDNCHSGTAVSRYY